jgi:peptidoglycan pentaglycine glycine transferase (the first glycine)
MKNDKKYLASALVVFTQSTAFYHQGASIHTKYPVPYLLQWEAIKEAKRRGCRYYNFWGISEPGRTPKAWSGLTLFKQGFGGHKVQYLPTQDLVLSPKYYFNWLYEKHLYFKRGI